MHQNGKEQYKQKKEFGPRNAIGQDQAKKTTHLQTEATVQKRKEDLEEETKILGTMPRATMDLQEIELSPN